MAGAQPCTRSGTLPPVHAPRRRGGCNFALPAHSPHHLCLACRQTHMLPPLADPLLRQRWHASRQPSANCSTPWRAWACKARPTTPRAGQPPLRPAGRPTGRASHPHRAPGRHHHAERGRGRRRGARAPPPGPARALPHAAGPPAPRIRPLLLGPAGAEAATGRLSRPVWRRAPGLCRRAAAHYADGPPPDWQEPCQRLCHRHPWEDWAETWAHYLHMVDLLETAAATTPPCGARRRRRVREPSPTRSPTPRHRSTPWCANGCR
jgi:hypothetical protein